MPHFSWQLNLDLFAPLLLLLSGFLYKSGLCVFRFRLKPSFVSYHWWRRKINFDEILAKQFRNKVILWLIAFNGNIRKSKPVRRLERILVESTLKWPLLLKTHDRQTSRLPMEHFSVRNALTIDRFSNSSWNLLVLKISPCSRSLAQDQLVFFFISKSL